MRWQTKKTAFDNLGMLMKLTMKLQELGVKHRLVRAKVQVMMLEDQLVRPHTHDKQGDR